MQSLTGRGRGRLSVPLARMQDELEPGDAIHIMRSPMTNPPATRLWWAWVGDNDEVLVYGRDPRDAMLSALDFLAERRMVEMEVMEN